MNEKQFEKYVANKLKQCNFNTVRVETGATGVGFPDMFVQGNGDDYFIEFKVAAGSIYNGNWKINWRPGQLAWHANYERSHVKNKTAIYEKYTAIKHAWTFVGLTDGMLLIRSDTCNEFMFSTNIVTDDMPQVFVFNKTKFSKLNLARFLQTYTYTVACATDTTLGIYINRLAHATLHGLFGVSYCIDYDGAPSYAHKVGLSYTQLERDMDCYVNDKQFIMQITNLVLREMFDVYIKTKSKNR